jgi:hypothetical protein
LKVQVIANRKLLIQIGLIREPSEITNSLHERLDSQVRAAELGGVVEFKEADSNDK